MPPRRRPNRYPAPLKLVLGLLVSILLICVIELLLIVAGVAPEIFFVVRPGLRLTLRSNLSDEMVRDHRAGTSFPITTDMDGLRLTGVTRPGAKNRILVMGDSMVFGWNQKGEQALPARLQAHLDRLTGKKDWWVMNGGQPGFSSLQSMLLLEQIGLSRKPTVVIVQFSLHNNKFAAETDHDQLGGGPAGALETFLLDNSRIYRLISKAALSATPSPQGKNQRGGIDQSKTRDPPHNKGDKEDKRPDFSRGVRVPLGDFARIVRRFEELAREHGFTMIWTGILDGQIPREYFKLLSKATRGKGTYFFDPNEPVRKRLPDASLRLAKDPGHWNAQGNDAIGQSIAEFLMKVGLVQ